MTLKDLLRKKDRIKNDENTLQVPGEKSPPPQVPEFRFIRSTTTTQEIISPPTFPGDAPPKPEEKENRKSRFRKGSNASTTSVPDHETNAKTEHRFSSRLNLRHRSRTLSSGSKSHSDNVPEDLPEVDATAARSDEDQAKWEKRATLLAKGNSISRPPSTPGSDARSPLQSPVSEGKVITVNLNDEGGDENIQEAIRLHESGDFERATLMFGRLADPSGANNALSQVLYGLALRHGWGCTENPELAVTYLSYAAANSADVEALALEAGMKKGGSAKGELVLAMFELANSFRNGWGVKKDPVAAKQYYETAANLGDTDAMNEVAWCYLEGFGCKKDKFKAAQYLRLAEEKGSKTLGNTWIWKDKYTPKT